MYVGSMVSGWYYAQREGSAAQQFGPVSWEALLSLARAGTLGPEDLVWHETFADWLPASQIAGLLPGVALPSAPRPYPAHVQAAPAPAAQSAAAYGTSRSRSQFFWAIPLVLLILVGGGLGAYFGLRGDGGAGRVVGDQASATTRASATSTTAPTATSTTATTAPTTTETTLPVVSANEDPIRIGDEFEFRVIRIGIDTTIQGWAMRSLSGDQRVLLAEMKLTKGEAEAFGNLQPEVILQSGDRSPAIVWIADGLVHLLTTLEMGGTGEAKFVPAKDSFTFAFVVPEGATAAVLEFPGLLSVDLSSLTP